MKNKEIQETDKEIITRQSEEIADLEKSYQEKIKKLKGCGKDISVCDACGNKILCSKCGVNIYDEYLWIRLDEIDKIMRGEDEK